MNLDFTALDEIAGGSAKRDQGRAAYEEPKQINADKAQPDAGPPLQQPDMMESWREVYRIFTYYAPLLRAAAETDGEYNDEAVRLFCEVKQRVDKMSKLGGDARLLAVWAYNLMNDVWEEARRLQTRQGIDRGL